MRLPKGKPMPSAVCRFQTQYLRNWMSWRVAEVLKDEFAYNQSQRRSIPLLSYKTKAGANYRAFWQDSLPMSPWVLQRTGLTHARTALTSKRFQNILRQLILRTKDIHSLTSALDTDTRKTVLPCCHCPKSNASVPKQESAHLAAVLFQKRVPFLLPLFGGQGSKRGLLWQTPKSLYDIHKHFVAPIRPDSRRRHPCASSCWSPVKIGSGLKGQPPLIYKFGLYLASWLSGAAAHPAVPCLCLGSHIVSRGNEMRTKIQDK